MTHLPPALRKVIPAALPMPDGMQRPGLRRNDASRQAGTTAEDDGVHVPIMTGRALIVMQGMLLVFVGLWSWLGWSIPR
ncbi:hypothetical protein [Acetobacter sp.]|uniref:hypothetical protein n=1 Tax=Acetobacter sp. TaxID=440 RepID=UPI0039ED1AFE